MDEAFSLKTDEISRLMKSGDNFIVLKLLEKTKERIPELDEVRSSVEKDFRKQEALESATKKAEEIIQALKDKSENPEEIATKYSSKWENLDPISRTAGSCSTVGKRRRKLQRCSRQLRRRPRYSEDRLRFRVEQL